MPRKTSSSDPAAQPPEQEAAAEAGQKLATLVEDLFAPEVFATEAQSFSLTNGMVTIAFTSSRYDYSVTPSELRRVVVSRLVMSPQGAQNLALRLYAFLDKNGLGPQRPHDPRQVQ
jgi:hypothetical protein